MEISAAPEGGQAAALQGNAIRDKPLASLIVRGGRGPPSFLSGGRRSRRHRLESLCHQGFYGFGGFLVPKLRLGNAIFTPSSGSGGSFFKGIFP
jgi:hypothetical protein